MLVTGDTDFVDVLGWDAHVLLLHRTEGERVTALASWVASGLAREEKILYTEVAARPERSVLLSLQRRGIDVARAQADGTLEVLPLSSVLSLADQVRAVDRATAEGFRAVRLCAEGTVARRALSPSRYRAFERRWATLCRTRPVSVLCQYHLATLLADDLRLVADHHPAGVREQRLATSVGNGRMTVAGEVDIANDDVLAGSLEAATRDATGVFTVDLRHLTFLGVAGCRAMTAGTEAFRRRGGELVITGSRPLVAQVLHLCSVGSAPGVRLLGL